MLTRGRLIKTSADISSLCTLIQKLFIFLLLGPAMTIAVQKRKEAVYDNGSYCSKKTE